VDPYDYEVEGTDSPEAQAFVVMMEAAYRDWVARDVSEASSAHSAKSAAGRSIGGGRGGWVWCLLGGWTLLHWIL
jgi:hypothetical protein